MYKFDIWPSRKGVEFESLLDALAQSRVFSIEKTPDGKYCFIDEVDSCFGIDLSRDEVLALADELIALTK